MTLNDLTVNIRHLKRERILADWKWLVGTHKLPVLVTAFGDAFLQDTKDENIYFLNVASADLTKVASSVEELTVKLSTNEFASDYLAIESIENLKRLGKTLSSGQVFSYIIPPVMGGKIEAENIEPCDLEVHFSIMGQVHEQVKDLPDGATISNIKVRKNGPKRWWTFWS